MTAPGPNLDALERLLEEATCQPWCVDDHIVTKGDTPGQWHVYEQCEDDPPLATCFHGRAEADARLIAAAVNALPALIAAARERDALAAHWCKDGETLAERLQRERDETVRLMGLLAAERTAREQAEEALADKRGGLQRAAEEWRDKYDREAASAAYAKDRAERAEQREARLRAALVKVRAHTSYHAPGEPDLLRGLLASIERIADAALAEGQDGE